MAWFDTSPARSICLGAPGYIINVLLVCEEGIQASGEGSNGTVTGIKTSSGQYPLVNVLTEDCSDCIVIRGIKPFPNQLFDYHFS